MWRERLVVVLLAGLYPGLLTQDRLASEFLDQPLRQLDALVVVAAALTVPGDGIAVRVPGQVATRKLVEQFAQSRVGPPLVDLARDERHLLRPVRTRSGGHVRPLIPAEQGFDRFEESGFTSESAEFVERHGLE